MNVSEYGMHIDKAITEEIGRSLIEWFGLVNAQDDDDQKCFRTQP